LTHKEKHVEEVYTCWCGETFTTVRSLLEHEEFHPYSVKPFECSECKKSFRRDCDLGLHKRIFHPGKDST
jgi:hypothetical protein